MRRATAQLLSIGLALLLAEPVLAACSPYYPLATINEIHRSGNADRFVEVKLIDTTIARATYSEWVVSICSADITGCTGEISLGNGLVDDAGLPWIVIPKALIPDANCLPLDGEFDVLLKDGSGAAGKTIDYFSNSGYEQQRDPGCTPYFDWQFGGSNGHTLKREPDGSGDWTWDTGNSVKPTTSDTNSPPEPPPDGSSTPYLNVANVTVERGGTAVFTVGLYEEDAGGNWVATTRTYDIHFSYQTLYGTAIPDDPATPAVDGDYYGVAAVEGVIPANSESTTVSVQTTIGFRSDSLERYFYLLITESDYAAFINQFAIGYITPAAFDHFGLGHNLNALTCEPLSVTISAIDTGGNAVNDYTGLIALSTSSGHGDWHLTDIAGDALGTLTAGASDNGSATYRFVDDDDGVVTLALSDAHAETFTITVADSAAAVTSSGLAVTFRPYGFTVTPDLSADALIAGKPAPFRLHAVGKTPAQPGCSPIRGYSGSKALNFWYAYDDPDSDSVVGTPSPTVADADEAVLLTSLEGDAGNRLTVAFDDGVGEPLSLSYPDAGRIRFYVKDDSGVGAPPAGSGSEIATGEDGAGNAVLGDLALVVRPWLFTIDFPLPASPAEGDRDLNGSGGFSYADIAGASVFATAGALFPARIKAVAWQAADDADADGIADPGADLYDNPTTASFNREASAETVTLNHALRLPDTDATAGVLSHGEAIGGFVNGVAEVELAFSEVGVIDLAAALSDGSYLGQDDVTGDVTHVGRFVPHHFSVTAASTPDFNTGCSGFSYLGQEFVLLTPPEVTIVARNAGGAPTENYEGDFWRLGSELTVDPNADCSGSGFCYASVVPLAVRCGDGSGADPATCSVLSHPGGGVGYGPVSNVNGTVAFTMHSGARFDFSRPVSGTLNPFDPDVALTIQLEDLDGIAGSLFIAHIGAYNDTLAGPDGSEGTADDDPDFNVSGDRLLRHGRLMVDNAFGSELLALHVPTRLEHYENGAFVFTADDNCTTGTDVRLHDLGSTLVPADTCVLDAGDPATDATTTACADPAPTALQFAEPAVTGSLNLWLAPAAGGKTGTIGVEVTVPDHLRYDWSGTGIANPQARATFGIFSGSDALIYIRERY